MTTCFVRCTLTTALLVVGLSLCLGSPAYGQAEHPQVTRIPHFDHAFHVGVDEVAAATKSNLLAFKRALSDGSAQAHIGERDGPSAYLIGAITDTEIYRNTILVLDSENRRVRRYTLSGEHVQSFGQAGDGPGEFSEPTDFTVDDNGDIWIADSDFTLLRFTLTDGEYTFSDQFKTHVNGSGVCTTPDGIYLYSRPELRPDSSLGTVHKYSRTGSHEASFGPTYETDNPVLRAQIAEASDVSCRGRTMLIQHRIMPAIFSIDLATQDVDWVTIFDHETLPMEPLTRSGRLAVRKNRPPRGAHFGDTIVENNSVVVASYRVRSESRTPRFKSYVLDFDNGTGLSAGTSSEKYVALTDSFAAADTKHIYPRIRISNVSPASH